MTPKAAVEIAKRHVADVFGSDHVQSVALEEIEFDDSNGVWNVTIGFTRERDRDLPIAGFALALEPVRERIYKVVRIDDKSETPISVKNRDPS
jgi:hypothetical protein